VKSGLSGRLAFADLLRGMAALGVVLGHFLVVFLTNPRAVAAITASEPSPIVPLPSAAAWFFDLFNLPQIGVAVFFLISGFVIPLSLEGTNTRAYLLKRFLRIFPPYWIALIIGTGAIFISAVFWSKPFPHTQLDYVGNTFLIANAFGLSDILSVAWTLQIEIKFYLLAPLIYMALKRGMLWPVLLCGAAITGVFWNATALCDNVHIACWDHYRFGVRILWFDAMFMVFMLMGSVFYAHYRKLIPNWQAVIGVLFLFACYQACVSATPLPFLTLGRSLPYFWGLILFAGVYFVRDKVTLTTPFRFLADISYSLYLIHALVGYVTIRLLTGVGLPYPASFAVALALVIALATAMHTYVEAPLIGLGKRLSTSWFGAPKRYKVPGLASRADAV
jgi:peptidoglycan/LPS O-acetylase OafA/YrhL